MRLIKMDPITLCFSNYSCHLRSLVETLFHDSIEETTEEVKELMFLNFSIAVSVEGSEEFFDLSGLLRGSSIIWEIT